MTLAPHHHLTIATEPVAAEADVLPRPRLAGGSEAATVVAVDDLISATLLDLTYVWRDLAPADPRGDRLAPESVLELLLAFASHGGKRLRPRMVHWGWVAAGGARHGDGQGDMVTAGAALELLHTFALVQDDVMDESQERRGRPAVHVCASRLHRDAGALGLPERYGESIAVLVGDLLHSEADALAGHLPAAMRAAWRALSIELIAGQAKDLVGAATGRRDLAHAQQVAAMKSGAYTVWRPLELGALAAGAGPGTLSALREFGHHLGVAFALRDDVLGVLGDPGRTGKPVGDDIVAGKPTVLLALAAQRFPARWRLALRRAGTASCSPEQAARLAEALVRFGVIEEVEGMIEAAVQLGSAALDDPAVDPAAADGLRALAHRIAWRDA